MVVRAITLSLAALTLVAAPKWTAMLQPFGDSRLSGTAVVEGVTVDSTRATIQVAGAKPGSDLAWHVHSGACGGKGQIFGAQSAYPALKAGPDGKAMGSVTLAAALASSGEYSVTVHKSSTDMTPAACGGLKSTGAPVPDSGMAPKALKP
jgi:hypothetical protein